MRGFQQFFVARMFSVIIEKSLFLIPFKGATTQKQQGEKLHGDQKFG
jgi:hypothetical protein